MPRISPGLLAIFLAACVPAMAQLSPSEPDPLARIRDAAKTNVQACSATGETLCEQVAPKIIANAQGDSPLAENLRRLSQGLKDHKARSTEEAPAVGWAVAAFRDAGVEVHTETYDISSWASAGEPHQQENVVAEIRGREKPDDWVLLGAHLNAWDPTLNQACNAALVIEAAHDIQLTGVRPRRSIRFVIFSGHVRTFRGTPLGGDLVMTGAWAYMRGHRNELDRERAAIIVDAGSKRVKAYTLNERRDIESGVREALKLIESMGITVLDSYTPLESDGFDFLLEGIPTLVATPPQANTLIEQLATSDSLGNVDIKVLKRNTAITAVTAFDIAERAEPLGPRQSRAEIESLLKTSRLEELMKHTGLWPLWETGERGRLP